MQICYCTLYIACIQLHLYESLCTSSQPNTDSAAGRSATTVRSLILLVLHGRATKPGSTAAPAARGVRPRLCPILAGSTLLRCKGRQCDFHERIGLSQGGNKARRMGHRNHRQGWVAPWQSESHVCSISKTTWRIFVLRLK